MRDKLIAAVAALAGAALMVAVLRSTARFVSDAVSHVVTPS